MTLATAARRRLPSCTALLAALLCCAASPAALAAASGTTYYAHGAQTVYSALLPAPGATQFYGYSLFYKTQSLRDSGGEVIDGVQGQAIALAPRVVHSWETPWQGFKLSSGAFALLVNVGVETPVGQQFDNGPTMFGVEPLYLSRSVGSWHFMLGPVIYIPWGNYNEQSQANATLNRYGGALNGGLPWTPTPRWDVSLAWGYEFKGRNRDTDYRDGPQTGLTYGVAHKLEGSKWDVGFSGYYTVQVEDDHQSGERVPNSRLRKFAVGPKLGYWFNPGSAVILQWHREFEARNAGQGNAYWVMFAFPLAP